MKNLKIHAYYTLSIIAVASVAFYFLHEKVSFSNTSASTAKVQDAQNSNTLDNGYKFTSQKGYHLIQPLLKVNQENESNDYGSLRAKIMNVVDDNQKAGILTSASVYLYSLSDGKWMYINPQEMFHPGSMIKVPMLITYLKEADYNPATLDKKIIFNSSDAVPVQTYNSLAIEKGHSYSINELLKYMVAYSDNNATKLLNVNADVKDFVKTFTDLNMPEPNVSDRNYAISAKNMSEFFIVLYYATYISKRNSEYAMALLTQCDFKEGFLKELPQNVKVAHKFGEWGDNRMNLHELHEAGIVYAGSKPYLLTIVTKGNNSKDLTTVISRISKLAYDDFSAIGNSSPNM